MAVCGMTVTEASRDVFLFPSIGCLHPLWDNVGEEGINLSWLRGTVRVKAKLLKQNDPDIQYTVLATLLHSGLCG